MKKEDFDVFPQFAKAPKSNSAADLLNSLTNRELGFKRNNVVSQEHLQSFAEEELIRKDLKEMRCETPGTPRSTFLMVFSPDGHRAASTHGNHNIYVTDLRNGKHIKTLIGHPRTPWCIAFHPTSNQIVASGCLGGQVRIWDLSGGSEVWSASSQSVIASIAFHPNDRVLAIATYNEVHFWDWSQQSPFIHVATSNPKEKVRYVAFDKLGHKLITGIANSPQTRWERVRAPVPVPRQERCASPYRRRITQRLVTVAEVSPNPPSSNTNQESPASPERGFSNNPSIPERERRITMCYRNLVREYELLVHRYLQLYRPPTMIDRGTDPMEPNHFNSETQTAIDPAVPGPSGLQNSGASSSRDSVPGPSGSQSNLVTQNLITPSRIFSVGRKPPSSIRGTQTTESRKHKANGEQTGGERNNEKRFKRNDSGIYSSDSSSSNESDQGRSQSTRASESASTSTVDQVPSEKAIEPSTSSGPAQSSSGTQCDRDTSLDVPSTSDSNAGLRINPLPKDPRNASASSSTSGLRYRKKFDDYIRQHKERIKEFQKRNQTIRNNLAQLGSRLGGSTDVRNTTPTDQSSQPADPQRESEINSSPSSPVNQSNVEELLSNIRRTAEEEVRNRILPIIRSVPAPDRPELIRLFENSRENVRMRFRQMCPFFLRRHCRRTLSRIDSSTDSSSSDNDQEGSAARRSPPLEGGSTFSASDEIPVEREPVPNSTATSQPTSRLDRAELDNLVSWFLNEIENTEGESPSSNNTPSTSTSPGSTSARTRPGVSLRDTDRPRYGFLRVNDFPRMESPGSSRSTPPQPPSSEYLRNLEARLNSSLLSSTPSAPTFSSRRRFFSHRMSAFMPTRVNYTRTRLRRHQHYAWGSGRSGLSRLQRSPSVALDELINFAERENSEDDPPSSSPFPGNIISSTRLTSSVQDLESSVNDFRVFLRRNGRSQETSDLLNSFVGRIDDLMTHSDNVVRNLRRSMDLMPDSGRNEGEPRWNFNDPGFYVRDLRTETSPVENSPNDDSVLLQDLLQTIVATDHTYPRNSNTSLNDSFSSMVNAVQLTVSHIQRQGRMLRLQVEEIERVERAMIEVGQLQLIRRMMLEMVRHIQSVSADEEQPTSRTAGVSSVRQMMAGTSISDSQDSTSDDVTRTRRLSLVLNRDSTSQPSTSQPGPTPQPRRCSNRKTYPPSRYFRSSRHLVQRRPTLVHWFSKRCLNRVERRAGQVPSPRPSTSRPVTSPPNANIGILNYSNINRYTLSLMTRRLERFLIEQRRRTQETTSSPPANATSSPSVDLGEHILALRLHGCFLRMLRVLGDNSLRSNSLRILRSDSSTLAATQDGASRYPARHTLSLIVDGMSRYIEELGTAGVRNSMRMQIHSVLAMSLLLSELLLIQVVDSIPPPSRMSMDTDRELRRINEMCTQLLQGNRVNSSEASQLTRSLDLMRQGHRVLEQTFVIRRNALMPRPETDRRQLLGTINRCLRTINRRTTSEDTGNRTWEENSDANSADAFSDSFYNTINDLITRYAENRDEEPPSQPSTSRSQNRDALSSNNENTDDDADESEFFPYRQSPSNTTRQSSPYRTNNTSQPPAEPSPPPWNVPSVQINDQPVPAEVSYFNQSRFLSQRASFVERVAEYQRVNQRVNVFRPRFLHPLYASVNPFDADLDDPQREQIYDSDMITTVTPNHRIQAWDISGGNVPSISNAVKNVIVGECKIHNDASVDIATDGTILVTLLPSGGYLNVTNRLGVYSLRWETLGQCLYTTSFEQNAVSVSLSPLSRNLVVGFASRRVSIVPTDRWVMARIYKIEQKDVPGDRLPILKELEQHRENRINCIRWLPTSGRGLMYATNTGQLVILS